MAEPTDDTAISKARPRPAPERGVAVGLLIGALLGSYVSFAGWPQSAPSPAVTIAVLLGGLVITIAIKTAVIMSRWRRAAVEINDAIALIARGQLRAARAVFRRWIDVKNVPRLQALARHNLAWTLMREGDIKQAVAVAIDNDGTLARELKALSLWPTSAADIALYNALLGNIEDALRWLGHVPERKGVAAMPTVPAMTCFVRAVVDCRSGRHDEAARALDEQWAVCEATLTGNDLRVLRVVRAFAHAAAGPRNVGTAESLLVSARPVFEGEYDCLGAEWPEMATFLAAHRLARGSAPVVASSAAQAATTA